MIRMTGVKTAGLTRPLDMVLPAGMSAVLVTSREREGDAVVRLLLGFQPPLEGELVVNGNSPYGMRENLLIDYRRKIGVIYHDGGLVSNLNVWDNLILQLSYHGSLRRADLEAAGIAALKRVGYEGALTVLPSRLSLYQRRLICMARAFMSGPELIIYQSAWDGLTEEEGAWFLTLAREFHQQGLERTALFLTPRPESVKGFEANFTYTTGGSTGHDNR